MEQPSEAFVRAMRDHRKQQLLTQGDLALLVSHVLGRNIDGSTVTRIEKGQRVVQLDEAIAIAKALKASLQNMLPVELSVEDEIASLEQARAVAYADLTRLDLTRQEIESSLAGIMARLQELEGPQSDQS